MFSIYESIAVHLGVRDEWDRHANAVAGDKGVPLAMGVSTTWVPVVAVRISRTGSLILIKHPTGRAEADARSVACFQGEVPTLAPAARPQRPSDCAY